MIKNTDLVQVPFDTSWMDYKGHRILPYKSREYVPNKEFITRGSDKSYMRVPIRYVDSIQELAKGFLFGSLYKLGLTLDEVVFLPADTVKHANDKGEPVYIFIKGDYFELESWFIEEVEYNRILSNVLKESYDEHN